jgi:hypothetical protein
MLDDWTPQEGKEMVEIGLIVLIAIFLLALLGEPNLKGEMKTRLLRWRPCCCCLREEDVGVHAAAAATTTTTSASKRQDPSATSTPGAATSKPAAVQRSSPVTSSSCDNLQEKHE